jgi:hypothetical protein
MRRGELMAKKKEKVLEQTIHVAYTYTRRVSLVEKRCLQCGRPFVGVKQKKYCSRACQAKADYERHAEQYRQRRVEKYHAKKNAAAGEK